MTAYVVVSKVIIYSSRATIICDMMPSICRFCVYISCTPKEVARAQVTMLTIRAYCHHHHHHMRSYVVACRAA